MLGWDDSANQNDDSYQKARTSPAMTLTRVGAIAFFATMVWADVKTIRGFFLIFLSTFGAYYIAKPIGAFAQEFYFRIRRPTPKVSINLSKLENSRFDFCIKSITHSNLYVESITLLDGERHIVPMSKAEFREDLICVSNSGDLSLNFILPGKGIAYFRFYSGRYDDVRICRAFGRFGNGSYWCVDAEIE